MKKRNVAGILFGLVLILALTLGPSLKVSAAEQVPYVNITVDNNDILSISDKSISDYARYVVTAPGSRAGRVGTVGYTGPQKNKTSHTVKDTVKINGITYKITSIAEGAFAGNKKLKKLTIGKNISSIGAGAFKGCKNLKKITINSTKLKTANLSAESFEGLREDVVIYVPAKKLKTYTRMFKKLGVKAELKAIK